MLIRTKKESGLEQRVEEIIDGVDVAPPQIMMDLRIVRVFADYTKDIGTFLSVESRDKDSVLPDLLIDLPGARLRVPDRTAE